MTRFEGAPLRRPSPRLILTLGLALAGVLGATAVAHAAQDSRREAIVRALNASAAGWSAGDLETFMRVYEPGPAPTYVKSTGVVHGYKAIHDMYAARFGGSAGMGKLSMEILDYKPLGAAYALVTGRYTLSRAAAEGGEATGLFTLVFHRTASGWRIVSDHSS